ncbi:hypothetical protein [Enterococcus sp. AZ192]|uniref:hypothetical protein n=1 Tax=unclassified Enterococcus TaxID=2608891 RepID=UPI003D2966CE
MKLKKLLNVSLAGIVIVGVYLTLNLTTKSEAVENEQYILAPTKLIRNSIFRSVINELEENGVVEEEIERFGNLFESYSIIEKQYGPLATTVESELQSDERSLEGLENLTNLINVSYEGGAFTDLRPLEKLTKLKTLEIDTENVQNIESLKKLAKLERLSLYNRLNIKKDFGTKSMALTDISALNHLSNLKFIRIHTDGDMPTITLRNDYQKYEVLDPIIVSNQFEGSTVEYTSSDENFSNADGLLKWENIPVGTESLELNWKIEKENCEFYGYARIPIEWK